MGGGRGDKKNGAKCKPSNEEPASSPYTAACNIPLVPLYLQISTPSTIDKLRNPFCMTVNMKCFAPVLNIPTTVIYCTIKFN